MTRNITGGTTTVKGLENVLGFSLFYPLLFYSIEPKIYVLYTGPNCTDIGQQLVKMKEEILEEIKAIKTNKTGEIVLKVNSSVYFQQSSLNLFVLLFSEHDRKW